MAGYKNKFIKQKQSPPERPEVKQTQNPDTFNKFHPSWCFSACDNKLWTFSANELFFEILPKLKEWETRTWNEILIISKKENHSIDTAQLNKKAKDRLDDLLLEVTAIISMRINSTHRIYGYRIGSVFYILWFDTNHGDNDTCVCRSRKKHT